MIQQFEFNAFWELLKTSLNNDLFDRTIPNARFLTPDNLLSVFADKGYQINRRSIPEWHAIEYGDKDLPLLELIRSVVDINTCLYMVSDESFSNGKVLYFQLNDQLTDDLVWEYCSLGPVDFIIASQNCSQICIVHHEGTVFYVRN